MFVYQEVLSKMFDENFKKRFANIYRFSNYEINKLVLLLQKAVYPDQYMWGRIQSSIITRERRFLQSPKYGRYY